jgi:hypothetical protein
MSKHRPDSTDAPGGESPTPSGPLQETELLEKKNVG